MGETKGAHIIRGDHGDNNGHVLSKSVGGIIEKIALEKSWANHCEKGLGSYDTNHRICWMVGGGHYQTNVNHIEDIMINHH